MLIVIEGLDGSGKATQAEKLVEYLKDLGQETLKISYPDYNSKSSTLVKMYLAGEIGTLAQVNVYAASSFYSMDRYISYESVWKKPYDLGHTIVADRYVMSNAIHQMPKLPKHQWEQYLEWLHDYEYKKLCLPIPDIVLYLDMHPDCSRGLLEKRYCGNSEKFDIHEQNIQYLHSCRKAALYAAKKLYWNVIECNVGDKILTVDEVFDKIKNIIQKWK